MQQVPTRLEQQKNDQHKQINPNQNKTDTVKKKECIYQMPCEYWRTYNIGEINRPMQVRIKNHRELVRLEETEKSGLAQLTWE